MDEIIELINTDYYPSGYEGVLIKTNKQEIKLLISSGQGCCETAGYLSTNDTVSEFIGAKVLGVTITDAGLSTADLEEDSTCCMMFCTIKTDKGDFQFTAYNSHNGYYSHEVKIVSTQLTTSEYV